MTGTNSLSTTNPTTPTAPRFDPMPAAQGFEPQTWKEMAELAASLSKSSIIPRALVGKPSDVLVILMNGRELGLGPMQALRQVFVVDGKPSLSAALKIGLCLKRRDTCEYFSLIESTDERATYETKRVGAPQPTRLTFTMQDAQQAGITGKDNWRKYPGPMLRARCGSALAEAVYPDLVGNLYDPDELEPSGPPPRRRAPQKLGDPVPEPDEAPPVVDAPAAPAAPPAAAAAPPVEFVAGGPQTAGAMLQEDVTKNPRNATQEPPAAKAPEPRPPEPAPARAAAPSGTPAPSTAAPEAITNWRGLTLSEWQGLTEDQRVTEGDITRKQAKLIIDLAKAKGITDHKLIVNSLAQDFAIEFAEWGVRDLWQLNKDVASYAVDQLKSSS